MNYSRRTPLPPDVHTQTPKGPGMRPLKNSVNVANSAAFGPQSSTKLATTLDIGQAFRESLECWSSYEIL